MYSYLPCLYLPTQSTVIYPFYSYLPCQQLSILYPDFSYLPCIELPPLSTVTYPFYSYLSYILTSVNLPCIELSPLSTVIYPADSYLPCLVIYPLPCLQLSPISTVLPDLPLLACRIRWHTRTSYMAVLVFSIVLRGRSLFRPSGTDRQAYSHLLEELTTNHTIYLGLRRIKNYLIFIFKKACQ